MILKTGGDFACIELQDSRFIAGVRGRSKPLDSFGPSASAPVPKLPCCWFVLPPQFIRLLGCCGRFFGWFPGSVAPAAFGGMTPRNIFRKRREVSAFLAFSEPRIDRTALSRFALFRPSLPDQPPYLPVAGARPARTPFAGTGNLARRALSGAVGAPVVGLLGLCGRGHAPETSGGHGSTRACRLRVLPSRRLCRAAGGGARANQTSRSRNGCLVRVRSSPSLAFPCAPGASSRQRRARGNCLRSPSLFLGSIRHDRDRSGSLCQARFSNGHLVEFCLLLYSEIAPGVLDQ